MRSPVKISTTLFAVPTTGVTSKPDVNRSRYQTLLLDLVTREANGKERSDDGNRFDEAFGYAPSTGPDNSAFNRSHRFDRTIDCADFGVKGLLVA